MFPLLANWWWVGSIRLYSLVAVGLYLHGGCRDLLGGMKGTSQTNLGLNLVGSQVSSRNEEIKFPKRWLMFKKTTYIINVLLNWNWPNFKQKTISNVFLFLFISVLRMCGVVADWSQRSEIAGSWSIGCPKAESVLKQHACCLRGKDMGELICKKKIDRHIDGFIQKERGYSSQHQVYGIIANGIYLDLPITRLFSGGARLGESQTVRRVDSWFAIIVDDWHEKDFHLKYLREIQSFLLVPVFVYDYTDSHTVVQL